MGRRAAWLVPLLLGAALRIPRGDGAPLAWDEAWYALAGQTYANLPNAILDQREGETVADALARRCPWGAVPRLEYKPAFVSAVAAASLPCRGISPLPGRIVSAVCGILLVPAAGALAAALGCGAAGAFAASLWVACSPLLTHISVHAMPTSMGSLWWALATLVAVRPPPASGRQAFGHGALTGLGPCIHPSLAVPAAILGGILLARAAGRRRQAVAGLLAPFAFFEVLTEIQTLLLHRAGFAATRPLWQEWFRRAPGIASPGTHLPGDPLFDLRLSWMSERFAAPAAWAGLALLAWRGGRAGRTALLAGALPLAVWSLLPHNLIRVHAPYWGLLACGAGAAVALAGKSAYAPRILQAVLCLLPLGGTLFAWRISRLEPIPAEAGAEIRDLAPDGGVSLYLGPQLRVLTGSTAYGCETPALWPPGAQLLVLATPHFGGERETAESVFPLITEHDSKRRGRLLRTPRAHHPLAEANDPFYWIELGHPPARADEHAQGMWTLDLYSDSSHLPPTAPN